MSAENQWQSAVAWASDLWRKHARTITLAGAFALPIYCASPLFFVPFAESIHYDSLTGALVRAAKMLPLRMTGIGFLVWLAWRSGWHPSEKRSWQMMALSFLAIIVLPLFCQALEAFTVFIYTDTWQSALAEVWRYRGPPHLYIDTIGTACRAAVILLVLRIAVWSRSIALSEPSRPREVTQPRFSIKNLMVLTAVVAVVLVFAPVVLRPFLWADQYELAVRFPLNLTASLLESTAVAVTILLMPWIGFDDVPARRKNPVNTGFDDVPARRKNPVNTGFDDVPARRKNPVNKSFRSLDMMLPLLLFLTLGFMGITYVAFRIRTYGPHPIPLQRDFSVYGALALALAYVFASLAVFAIFRAIGLHVSQAKTATDQRG